MNEDSMPNDMDIEETASEISDIEWQLDHLSEFDNVKQLELLKKEVGYLSVHGIVPSEGWYDERYKIIATYSKIDWTAIYDKFKAKDEYLSDRALFIRRCLDELLEERATKPNFHIQTYYTVIHEIDMIWRYYKEMYMGEETEEDVIDLIEAMSFL